MIYESSEFFLNMKFDKIYDFDILKKLIKSFLENEINESSSNIEFTFLEFCLELRLGLTRKNDRMKDISFD